MEVLVSEARPKSIVDTDQISSLCFIIPGTIAGLGIYLYFPDTNGIPLEEVSAMFGVSSNYIASQWAARQAVRIR